MTWIEYKIRSEQIKIEHKIKRMIADTISKKDDNRCFIYEDDIGAEDVPESMLRMAAVRESSIEFPPNTTVIDEDVEEKNVPKNYIRRANIREFIFGFFKRVSDWFMNIWDFVQNVKRYAVFGAKVFLSRIGNRFRMFSEYYSQSNQYRKTIAYSEELIDFQDVPQEILRKYYSSSGNMVDISQELQLYT